MATTKAFSEACDRVCLRMERSKTSWSLWESHEIMEIEVFYKLWPTEMEDHKVAWRTLVSG